MKSKQIMFFATLEDIKPLFQEIEDSIKIFYYSAGLYNCSKISTFRTIFETSNLAFVSSGDWNKIERYLILKEDENLNIREVIQRDGSMKFAVDQMNNLKSLEFKIGGIFSDKEKVIVAGRVSTISDDIDSNELFKLFSSRIKRNFKKNDTFYVGSTAETKLKEGWRLVTNEKSPIDYDLKIK